MAGINIVESPTGSCLSRITLGSEKCARRPPSAIYVLDNLPFSSIVASYYSRNAPNPSATVMSMPAGAFACLFLALLALVSAQPCIECSVSMILPTFKAGCTAHPLQQQLLSDTLSGGSAAAAAHKTCTKCRYTLIALLSEVLHLHPLHMLIVYQCKFSNCHGWRFAVLSTTLLAPPPRRLVVEATIACQTASVSDPSWWTLINARRLVRRLAGGWPRSHATSNWCSQQSDCGYSNDCCSAGGRRRMCAEAPGAEGCRSAVLRLASQGPMMSCGWHVYSCQHPHQQGTTCTTALPH